MKIDTVNYNVNWRKFHKGYSFFVPCIDIRAAKQELERTAKRLGLSLVTKVVVQGGVKGLRVWRM